MIRGARFLRSFSARTAPRAAAPLFRKPPPIARYSASTMAKTLATIPIEKQGAATAAGTVTITVPADRVYLVTFESPPDNRLSTNFIKSYLLALDIIEERCQNGVVVTTSGIKKFYSNGMDLDHVAVTPNFHPDSFYPLYKRLATFPMPTVALINGHAFAGGLILAMFHDYRVQNPDKGFLSMNEVLFGAIPDPPLLAIYREKVKPTVFRDLFLEGHRYAAQEALKEGLVDALGGWEETLEFINKRKLVTMGDTGIYGKLKEDMYRITIDYLMSHGENIKWRQRLENELKVRRDETKAKVEAWEKKNGKAKL